VFLDGAPDGLLEPLTAALESVYETLVEHGTLPIRAASPGTKLIIVR
jgi:hypothetical protein